MSAAPFAVGQEVRTDFYPRAADKVRVVTACLPALHASESGWRVSTSGLTADANWFTCAACGQRGGCACKISDRDSAAG